MNPFWLQLSLVVALSAYLFAQKMARLKLERQADAARRAVRGRGFEAEPVLRQMEQVRHDYLASARAYPRANAAHQDFANRVGNSLRRLAFFSRRERGEEAVAEDRGA